MKFPNYKIWKNPLLIFSPLTKENTISDYKIRKLKSIFEKNKVREETHGWEK